LKLNTSTTHKKEESASPACSYLFSQPSVPNGGLC